MKLKFNRDEIAKLIAGTPDKKAKITIVKDDGIYIMSFGQPKEKRTIVYAKGFNPNVNGDVWDKCRDAVGGDDFGETASTIEEMADILKESVGDIGINVTASSVSVFYLPKIDDKAVAEYWAKKKEKYRSEPIDKLNGYLRWYASKPRKINAVDRKKAIGLILEVMTEKRFTPTDPHTYR